MNKLFYVIPLMFIIPLSVYATDQTITTSNIFGHIVAFKLSDKLIILNNDTNFSHSIKAINNQGYVKSTPSLFPQQNYRIQFEQPGNYTVTDEMNSKNIGYINVIDDSIPVNNTSLVNTTITFSTSNATNPVIAQAQSLSSTSSDVTYWKSQAMTWKYIAEQLQQKLDALTVK